VEFQPHQADIDQMLQAQQRQQAVAEQQRQAQLNQPEAVSPPIDPSTDRQPFQLPDILARRNFLKWAGFSGVGLFGTLWWAQTHQSNTLTTPGQTLVPAPLPSISSDKKIPPLTTIQFASVKLNAKGEIIEKPKGKASAFNEDIGNGVLLTMVKIPAGKFMMGSPTSEKDRYFESPQHQISVPEFYFGQTLVTQAQWQVIMGNNPSGFKGNDKLPVEQVNWLDSMDFCQKLSEKMNRNYRLPSEAEWEYACRAGTTTPFAFGATITSALINCDGTTPYGRAAKGDYRKKTTPVRSFPPNLFGLYDMHGNLWEWCLDEWADNYNGAPTDGSPRGNFSRDDNKSPVLRGGSWLTYPHYCRSASRPYQTPDIRLNSIGFRVVCEIPRTL
jgi:eukaryotic-like serine/threonine-protein kinase